MEFDKGLDSGRGERATRGMDGAERECPMSLGVRLVRLPFSPGAVFEAVVSSGFSLANWLVPSAIAGLVGLVLGLVLQTQPELVRQREASLDREIDRRVASGRMRVEEASEARTRLHAVRRAPGRSGDGVGAVEAALLKPFGWGALLWGVGRFVFASNLPYLRAVEVAGLSGLIGTLGTVVSGILALVSGNAWAGPHAGMGVSGFDPGDWRHQGLAALDLFALWQLGVMSTGLARWVRRPLRPVLLVTAGGWVGVKAFTILLGMGTGGL